MCRGFGQKTTAKFKLKHEGVTYYFCSVKCKKRLKRNRVLLHLRVTSDKKGLGSFSVVFSSDTFYARVFAFLTIFTFGFSSGETMSKPMGESFISRMSLTSLKPSHGFPS